MGVTGRGLQDCLWYLCTAGVTQMRRLRGPAAVTLWVLAATDVEWTDSTGRKYSESAVWAPVSIALAYLQQNLAHCLAHGM